MRISNLQQGILFLLSGLLSASTSFGVEQYSREANLPPIKISYDAITATLKKLDAFVSRANGIASSNMTHVIKIGAVDNEVAYRGALGNFSTARFPDIGYSLRYLSSFTEPEKNSPAISDVSLLFNDSFRTITVQGYDQEQVDSLFLLLLSEIEKHTAWVGGDGRRILLSFAIMLLVFAIGCLIAYERNNSNIINLSSACSVLVMICFLFLPMKRLLPGFSAMSGEVSFIRRYSSEIGFYGTVAPFFITGILAANRMIRKKGTRSNDKPNRVKGSAK